MGKKNLFSRPFRFLPSAPVLSLFTLPCFVVPSPFSPLVSLLLFLLLSFLSFLVYFPSLPSFFFSSISSSLQTFFSPAPFPNSVLPALFSPPIPSNFPYTSLLFLSTLPPLHLPSCILSFRFLPFPFHLFHFSPSIFSYPAPSVSSHFHLLFFLTLLSLPLS